MKMSRIINSWEKFMERPVRNHETIMLAVGPNKFLLEVEMWKITISLERPVDESHSLAI